MAIGVEAGLLGLAFSARRKKYSAKLQARHPEKGKANYPVDVRQPQSRESFHCR